jgi:hypothetical protein
MDLLIAAFKSQTGERDNPGQLCHMEARVRRNQYGTTNDGAGPFRPK